MKIDARLDAGLRAWRMSCRIYLCGADAGTFVVSVMMRMEDFSQ